jgi:tRNA(Arg) A34 adenosine deaminase TadA
MRLPLLSRRSALAFLSAFFAMPFGPSASAVDERRKSFVDKAFEMKRLAESRADQAYGAVIVRGEQIVGLGPSRVMEKKDWTAHAEREAIRDAQARLATNDLSNCVMYSTSRPCDNCEGAAANANIARMFYGADAMDAGRPRSASGPTR